MVLEVTLICIDNSEWMPNGNYSPMRFQAQADSFNLICRAKTQTNPENTVGVLTVAGKGVRVLVTPTSDHGKILAGIEEDEEKTEKLEDVLAAVNNNDSSHIVHVPSGPSALSDVLISTPIFTGDGEGGSSFAAAAVAAAVGRVSGFNFGVDPNLDPEMALAFRVSMEEGRARQEAAAKKAAEEASKQGGEFTSQDTTMPENVAAAAPKSENKTNDPMALAMSMDDPSTLLETLICQRQLELIKTWHLESSKEEADQTDMSKLLADQSFVSSMIAQLPGVDPSDPSIKDLLASMQTQSEEKEEDKASSEEEK